MDGAMEARKNRRLMTRRFSLPSKLARKQQISSVAEMHFAGVRQSWAIGYNGGISHRRRSHRSTILTCVELSGLAR
jgi:hypothetical protein